MKTVNTTEKRSGDIKEELLAGCKEALEALYNLNPEVRKTECFNGKDCGFCTACNLIRVIAKADRFILTPAGRVRIPANYKK